MVFFWKNKNKNKNKKDKEQLEGLKTQLSDLDTQIIKNFESFRNKLFGENDFHYQEIEILFKGNLKKPILAYRRILNTIVDLVDKNNRSDKNKKLILNLNMVDINNFYNFYKGIVDKIDLIFNDKGDQNKLKLRKIMDLFDERNGVLDKKNEKYFHVA